MEPKFSKIVSAQMESAAKKAYPCECCGILVGKKSEKGEIEVQLGASSEDIRLTGSYTVTKNAWIEGRDRAFYARVEIE